MNNGKIVSVSASIGISVFPGDGDAEESLIGCADSAMYEVKNKNKGGYQFFSESKSSPLGQPQAIKLEMVDALESGQFVVFYQPLFDREYERVIGLEALFRWHHPKKGLIFPSEILPEARCSGLAPLIDEWVFNKVRDDFSEMRHDGIGDIKLFLNLSIEKFSESGFGNWLAGLVSGNSTFAENLHIEIPSEALGQPDATLREKFDRIRSLGIKAVIEIDGGDELRRLPLHDYGLYGLKIDLAGLDYAKESRPGDFSQGFNGLLQRKGLNLIAKKVDFPLEPSKYWPMEFNMVQGFLYYHPLPLRVAKSVIKSTRSI
jgi:EAL domain-containing protein (putative c-di-GMP-specific phosphodiesterase class I)